MNISIDKLSDDALQQTTWRFYVCDSWHGHHGIAVILDDYISSYRATKRHKFVPVIVWTRDSCRGRYNYDVKHLNAPPETPQWVRNEVMKRLMGSVAFFTIIEKGRS